MHIIKVHFETNNFFIGCSKIEEGKENQIEKIEAIKENQEKSFLKNSSKAS